MSERDPERSAPWKN